MEDINQEDPPIGVDQGDSEGNPCVICPFERYIDKVPGLTEQDKAENLRVLKRKGAADTCNRYAKQRKMDIFFELSKIMGTC